MTHETIGNNLSDPNEFREQNSLAGKIALVTGSSRDIGAGIAISLAREGVSVIGNHRDAAKTKRAQDVQRAIAQFGGRIEFVVADITKTDGREKLSTHLETNFPGEKLDFLILNASGPTKEVNVYGANGLVDRFLPEMPRGGRVVLMQSIPGHFYDQEEYRKEIPKFYLPIAEAKKAGEESLLARLSEFEEKGVGLTIICPPAVSNTNNMKLFKRIDSAIGERHERLATMLGIPTSLTITQVADRVVELLKLNPPSGYLELFKDFAEENA